MARVFKGWWFITERWLVGVAQRIEAGSVENSNEAQ